jgi:hypothetical protein
MFIGAIHCEGRKRYIGSYLINIRAVFDKKFTHDRLAHGVLPTSSQKQHVLYERGEFPTCSSGVPEAFLSLSVN